jgi:hypothetical protein
VDPLGSVQQTIGITVLYNFLHVLPLWSKYSLWHPLLQTPSVHILRLQTSICTNFNVLLTVHLSITLANDQLDAKLFYFIILLLQSSTCSTQRCAHHEEVNSIWYRHSVSGRVTIPDAVLIKFDLLMMSTMLLETCRGL